MATQAELQALYEQQTQGLPPTPTQVPPTTPEFSQEELTRMYQEQQAIAPMPKFEDVATSTAIELAKPKSYSPMDIAMEQLQSVGEGAMLGWRDEAEAGLTGLFDDRPYADRLSSIEARREQYTDQYPTQSGLAEMAGMGFTGAVTGGRLAPKTMMGSGVVAGVEGGIYGAGKRGSMGAAEDATLSALTAVGMNPLARVAYRAVDAYAAPMAKRVADFVQELAGTKKKEWGPQFELDTEKFNRATSKGTDFKKYLPSIATGTLPLKIGKDMAKGFLKDVASDITPAKMRAIDDFNIAGKAGSTASTLGPIMGEQLAQEPLGEYAGDFLQTLGDKI